MPVAGLVAAVVCAAAVVGLVAAERARSARGRYIAKPIASAAFVAIPLVTGAVTGAGATEVARWIALGLVLGAIGDVCLMFDHPRWFLAGLVAFLLGHVADVVAFARLLSPRDWLDGPMAAIAIAAVAIAAIVLRWLWPHLGAMRGPVIAYVVVITTMLIGGLAIRVHDGGAPGARTLLAAGAITFFLSDLAVARERFVVSDRWNRYVGLPVYYGAQVLMAWAIAA